MSYILDALKKAAEQRNAPAPEVRRLLSPAPVSSDWTGRRIIVGAAVGGAIAAAVAVWLWPASPESTARPVAAVTGAPVQAERPRPPASAADAPTRSDAPVPSVAPPTEKLAEPPRPAARPPVAARPAPRTTPSAMESRPPVVARPAPTPPPVAATPSPAVAPAAPRAEKALKLEVIVYSDERPKRMVFINGRKYVEGDTVGDGARIEEIQSNAVVIVEEGRRVTLRP
ncbi:MAG TPA: general secretion pathway protein GspB [Methylomirabilota bacterium]|nr:general secretion pathway protein GspB [Methylomirabilota bacterium]